MFMMSVDGQTWNGQFTGSPDGWKESLKLLKTIRSKDATDVRPEKAGKPEGPVLTYEIDPGDAPAGVSAADMDKLLKAVDRRLNAGPERLARVRKLDDGRIEVASLRRNDADRQRVERLLARPARWSSASWQASVTIRISIERAEKDQSKAEVLDASGKRLAWWAPVKAGEEGALPATPTSPGGRRSKAIAKSRKSSLSRTHITSPAHTSRRPRPAPSAKNIPTPASNSR